MEFDRKREINVLINLAAIDGKIEEREVKLIHSIGKANGLSAEEIDQLIRKPEPIAELSAMTNDEKFEHLYYMIQMMRMDGKVFKTEIAFCENIAEKLGYRKGVIMELAAYIFSDPSITADRKMLRQLAEKFIRS
jgi:uncharacterized membrane protein YebE (DUF533 family)